MYIQRLFPAWSGWVCIRVCVNVRVFAFCMCVKIFVYCIFIYPIAGQRNRG